MLLEDGDDDLQIGPFHANGRDGRGPRETRLTRRAAPSREAALAFAQYFERCGLCHGVHGRTCPVRPGSPGHPPRAVLAFEHIERLVLPVRSQAHGARETEMTREPLRGRSSVGGATYRLLSGAIDLRPDEVRALAWSWLYIFCVLSSFYIIRPIRDDMGVVNVLTLGPPCQHERDTHPYSV